MYVLNREVSDHIYAIYKIFCYCHQNDNVLMLKYTQKHICMFISLHNLSSAVWYIKTTQETRDIDSSICLHKALSDTLEEIEKKN